jgi:conjugative transfer signal peptidase TraF
MTRFGYVMTSYVAIMATVIPAFLRPSARLVWNATASVPVGLYRAAPHAAIKVGDLVSVRPPPELEMLLAKRHYVPLGVPMLKPVAALSGQIVCRSGHRILVDGRYLGDARTTDSRGRRLPIWAGCTRLEPGQVFLMSAAVPDSFDGRYFGPLPAATLLAKLTPLWLPSPPARP